MTLFGDCDHGDPWDDAEGDLRGWDGRYGDGPGLDWDDGPEPPPERRVVAIKTTGERL